MPELPELQAHAERLDEVLAGDRLSGLDVLSFTAIKTVVAPDPAVGRPLERVRRRGKHLILDFGPISFVVHLMQGGRLSVVPPGRSGRPRGGLLRWHFDDSPDLLLTEAGREKRAGVWVVEGDPLGAAPLGRLGPEADTISPGDLAAVLAGRSSRLHGVLRDQHVIAGIGRRLANEVCHGARLSPFATASNLTTGEVEQLHAALVEVIRDSLRYERDLGQMSRAADRPAVVHDRKGQPCPRCDDAIRSVEYRAYTVHYCPTCQTAGKVLADNTTSRFLK